MRLCLIASKPTDAVTYGFLPAAKYQDWKVLDLRISPGEMAGG